MTSTRDGDLDAFLLNHPIEKYKGPNFEKARNSYHQHGADKLLENQNGKFVDISSKAGIIGNPLGFGLGLSISDLNMDGWPDIYVANDYSEPDYMYYNNQDGTFKEVIKDMTGHISNFAMGVDVADINNDGFPDILTAEMAPEDNYSIKTSMASMSPKQFWNAVNNGLHYQYMYNTLQLNLAGEQFSEIGQLSGISNTGWSWAPLMADFDNDGLKDIFISNGYKRDNSNNDFKRDFKTRQDQFEKASNRDTSTFIIDIIERIPELKLPNYIYKNNGDLTFTNQSADWGLNNETFSNGAAYADLDNDGDLDLVINNINQEVQLYRNNISDNHYLKISLEGSDQNLQGIGSIIKVFYNGQTQQYENYPTRGYQSCVGSDILVGLGKFQQVDSLQIQWPKGETQTLKNVSVDQKLILQYQEGQPAATTKNSKKIDLLFTTDDTLTPSWQHKENEFDDFERDGLLPHKMSEFGPYVTVGDANNDGLEDFFVGGAAGLLWLPVHTIKKWQLHSLPIKSMGKRPSM